jgi:hypothetical protein
MRDEEVVCTRKEEGGDAGDMVVLMLMTALRMMEKSYESMKGSTE